MTNSAVSDRIPNNVLCNLDDVLWNGNDLEKFFIGVFLPIESRLHPDLVDFKPSLPKSFRNSPVINTKFANDTHLRVPTITEYNTTETRQRRLQ